jgi:hypothetical protein
VENRFGPDKAMHAYEMKCKDQLLRWEEIGLANIFRKNFRFNFVSLVMTESLPIFPPGIS